MLIFNTAAATNKVPAASFMKPKFTSFARCKSAPAKSAMPVFSGASSLRRAGTVPVTCNPKQSKSTAATARSLSDVIADVHLNPKGLHKRYKLEYTSWRAMKRRTLEGFSVAPGFMEFDSFLCLMGRRPTKDWTLDRIDSFDPEYAPGKCRWLGKTGQTRNRRGTHVFQHPHVNRKFYAPEVAEMTGVKENTVRARRRQGWTDREIIEGRRLPPSATDCTAPAPVNATSPAFKVKALWETAVSNAYPGRTVEAVLIKHVKQIENLLRIPEREFALGPALEHVAAKWVAFTLRVKNQCGVYTAPLYPMIDFALKHNHIAIDMHREARENTVDIFKGINPFADPKPAPTPVKQSEVKPEMPATKAEMLAIWDR